MIGRGTLMAGRYGLLLLGLALFLVFTFSGAAWSQNTPAEQKAPPAAAGPPALSLSLDQSIEIAIKNNHSRPASQFAVDMAEAQHRQALSAYWPQITLNASYTTMGDAPNFIFPSTSIPVPGQVVTIPGNAFAPGFPPQAVQLPVPSSQFTIPQQDLKLMNKDLFTGQLKLNLPLYTGGLIESKVKQAQCGVEIAKQEARRTDLQVMYDVKRMYYGAVFARELYKVGKDTHTRLAATMELTENLYQKGSGTVKKTDYLRNKVIVEAMRTAVIELENNEEMARAALVNTMGLPWNTQITLTEPDVPFRPYGGDLTKLVSTAYEFNPDWLKFNKGIEAAQAGVQEANSGFLPKVAITGSLNVLGNSLDSGLMTPTNKNSWIAGVGLSVPVFDGSLTHFRVKEAAARVNKMKEEKIVFQEGLALQIKQVFLQMMTAQRQDESSKSAKDASEENRKLNVRAYQDELVKTVDVIESQLIESLMAVQYLKAHYDHIAAQSHLDYVIGREVEKFLNKE
jgi:outer membrane protein